MPLHIFNAAMNALRDECRDLASECGVFLETDEAGNIWLGDGEQECYRVYGWHMAHQKLTAIKSRKELLTDGCINLDE